MFVSGVGLTNQWTLIKQLVHVQRCYIYVVNLMAPDMYKQCETQIQEMCDGESGRHKTAEEGEKREGAQRWGGGGGHDHCRCHRRHSLVMLLEMLAVRARQQITERKTCR